MWPTENNTYSGYLGQHLKEEKFCNEAIAIEKEKHKINFNKTIHIRVSILDLSKVLM